MSALLKLVTNVATRSPSKRRTAPVDSSISFSRPLPLLTEMAVTSIAKTLGPPAVSDRTLALVDGQLEVVRALSKIDPEYPADLASGILFLWLGDRDRATRALSSHLAGPRSSFWRLRARNALSAAVQL